MMCATTICLVLFDERDGKNLVRRSCRHQVKRRVADVLLPQRWRIGVETAGSGKLLVPQFYFNSQTTVADLRAEVLSVLPPGFDCRLFSDSQLRIEATMSTCTVATVYNTGQVVYAVPQRRDDKSTLLMWTACAQRCGWTKSAPIHAWRGVTVNEEVRLTKLELRFCFGEYTVFDRHPS